MAVPFSCHCPERKKPVEERNWVVIDRNCHYSAFNGYKRTWSERSTVLCKSCGAVGRTKAKYVVRLKDESEV
jgi:hypothetical protein